MKNEFLSIREAWIEVNAALDRQISLNQFRTIYELMADRGDARRTVYRQPCIVHQKALPRWIAYLRERQRRIAAGWLPSNHPYSLDDFQIFTQEAA